MKSITTEQAKAIPTLFAQGMTRIQVAKHLGVSEATIQRWVTRLKKAGYTLEKQSAGRKQIEL